VTVTHGVNNFTAQPPSQTGPAGKGPEPTNGGLLAQLFAGGGDFFATRPREAGPGLRPPGRRRERRLRNSPAPGRGRPHAWRPALVIGGREGDRTERKGGVQRSDERKCCTPPFTPRWSRDPRRRNLCSDRSR